MIPKDKLIAICKTLIKRTTGGTIYPYQLKLIESDAPFKCINKSRQTGISYLYACWGFLQALLNDKTILVVSPSERQSKHLMSYVYKFLNEFRKDYNIYITEETKSNLTFVDGGSFYSLPNNPNTVRGFRADMIIFDEFAHFLNGTDKEIMEAVMPSISRGGEIVFISTPFGSQNEFYKIWHDEGWQGEKFIINYRDCPDLNIDKIRANTDEITFAQEYDNAFITDSEGQEFPEVLIRSCINPELSTEISDTNKVYVGGVDIGRHEDMTALVFAEVQEDRYIIRHVEAWRNMPFKEQHKRLAYYLSHYNFQEFNMDATGLGEMLVEVLGNEYHINPVKFTNDIKQKMVLNLKREMQNGNVSLPDTPQLVSSIRAIQRKYTDTNYLKFDSPRNSDIGHADLFWALALALYKPDDAGGLPSVVRAWS